LDEEFENLKKMLCDWDSRHRLKIDFIHNNSIITINTFINDMFEK
jgi:hypothetical protein